MAREHTDAADFGSRLAELDLPVLIALVHPDPNDIAALEECCIDLKMHKEKECTRKANTEKVFFLVLGQCSRAVHD